MCSRVCGPLGKPPPPNFTRYSRHHICSPYQRICSLFLQVHSNLGPARQRPSGSFPNTHRFPKHVAHSVCGGLHLVRPWGPRGGLPEPTRPLHHRRARAGQDHHTNRARAMRGHVGSERGGQTETVVVTDQSCRLYCCNGRDEKHCRGCDGPLGRGFRHKRFVNVPSSF
jgi:hypothetical protein